MSISDELNQEEIAQQQELLEIRRRSLADLLLQAAQHSDSSDASVHVIKGIYEARENIRQIKATLRANYVPVEDHHDDEPLPQEPSREQDHSVVSSGTSLTINHDQINAHSTIINDSSQFTQRNVNTAGGDYAEGDIDKRRGVFVDDVGSGAQVAIGRSITQVGSLVLNVFHTNLKPILLLLILVSFGIIYIVFLLQRPQGPSKMLGTFNIAVAPFDLIEDGRSSNSEQGEQVATWLTEDLKQQQQVYPSGTRIEIWEPQKVGHVPGINREARAEAARLIAEKINANIVIYGYLEKVDNAFHVVPEFYVANSGFDEAEEITGEYQLGRPIKVSIGAFQNPILSANINRELNARSFALSQFTIGLLYFQIEDFQSAFTSFSKAEAAPDWKETEGKEVIYLFLGNAALKSKEFETAINWFDRAIKSNSEYARAYIGKAEAFYQQAILSLANKDAPHVDIPNLDTAILNYEAGLKAKYQPTNADVAAKAHFGLGRSFLLKSQQEKADLWADAEAELTLVTTAYEAGNVRLQELAAQAYNHMGLLHYIRQNDNEAIKAYEQAIKLERYQKYKAEYAKKLSELYRVQGNSEASSKYANLADTYSKSSE